MKSSTQFSDYGQMSNKGVETFSFTRRHPLILDTRPQYIHCLLAHPLIVLES